MHPSMKVITFSYDFSSVRKAEIITHCCYYKSKPVCASSTTAAPAVADRLSSIVEKMRYSMVLRSYSINQMNAFTLDLLNIGLLP